jgi:integrase
MQERNSFNIFPRRLKNGKTIYYYYIYDESGKRKQYSTGKDNEKEAYQVCLHLMKQNKLNHNSSFLFERYCQDWFVYDKCDYIQAKLMHGYTYSRTFADHQRGQLEKHIIPFFQGKTLDNIRASDAEAFIACLKQKGLSNVSINHNLKILRLIFGWAEKKNDIDYNPFKEVMNLKSDCKEKGMFTSDEIFKLLLDKTRVEEVWANNRNDYLMNLVAYKTGARLGELQALQKSDLQDGYIIIQHSLDRKYGLKSTKTGKVRQIPIQSELLLVMKRHAALNEGDFVFGKDSGRRPIRHDEVYTAFHAAALRIGLTKEALQARHISFHSYRHGVATRLTAANVAPAMIRAITGHSTQAMLDHYTHIGIPELRQAVGEL